MNKFSELLLRAFDVAMDGKISNLGYDRTIQASITEIKDPDTGEYRVKYQDGIITAFAADPKEEFKIQDVVYVTIPEGDFSNKKFISHKLSNNSLSAGQYSQLSEVIVEVSPNFSELGVNINPPQDEYWKLPANPDSGIDNDSEETIFEEQDISTNQNIQNYFNKYDYIQIKADFKTQFNLEDEDYLIQGDYGLALIFSDANDNEIPYFLSTRNFLGDPYHLWAWTPQSVIVKFPKGTITSIKGFKFYVKGFSDDIAEGVDNIFMRNPSVSFIEKVDFTQSPYYLSIVSDKGLVFSGENINNAITLTGQIYNYGNIISPTNCVYQWFKRDLSVMVGSETYDKRAGQGWSPIENENNNSITVLPSEVLQEQTYKLIVVFDSNVLMTKEVTLIKNKLNVTVQQIIEGNVIKLKLSDNTYKGIWYYLTLDGDQHIITSDTAVNETDDISSLLTFSPIVIYCAVYDNQDNYCGELNYVLRSSESNEDVSVFFIGEDIFSYDANGDINIYDAELEKSLQAEIVWREGIYGNSCTIEWFLNDTLITSAGIQPDNSMFKFARVDSSTNILYYKIKHKYQLTPQRNNTFRIQITTIDGQVYSFNKQIIFTKTGDPGTNGTRYQSLITITSANKFVGVSDSNTSITLNCKVYKDQAEFSGASVSWQPYNLAEVSHSGMSVIVRANNNVQQRYVKATITIVDEGKTTILYDFYPVNSCASQPNIDLSELPKYIQYASNGRNPQFRKQVPIITYNDAIATIASGDTDLIKIVNNQFKPIDEFNPNNPIGLLTVTISEITIYHPVPMYINTFGNEAINGWDGVSVDVDTVNGKIFAPQIGAGTKNNANKFTGVVMGKDSAQQKVGLYGYQAGVNSFGLTEDGIAYFGTENKNRITIDGTSATIIGGKGGSDSEGNGMTITLSAATSSTDAIRIGNGKFVVKYDGSFTATSATISGNITATSGTIGGWTINQSSITAGSTTLDSSGNVTLGGNIVLNGTITWSGTNNPNTWPPYCETTYISSTSIFSPTIYANNFNVRPNPNESGSSGGYHIYGKYLNATPEVFSITYTGNTEAVYMDTPWFFRITAPSGMKLESDAITIGNNVSDSTIYINGVPVLTNSSVLFGTAAPTVSSVGDTTGQLYFQISS